MSRFVPADIAANTLERPGFLDFLSRETGDLLRELRAELQRRPETGTSPTFEL